MDDNTTWCVRKHSKDPTKAVLFLRVWVFQGERPQYYDVAVISLEKAQWLVEQMDAANDLYRTLFDEPSASSPG